MHKSDHLSLFNLTTKSLLSIQKMSFLGEFIKACLDGELDNTAHRVTQQRVKPFFQIAASPVSSKGL